jgi:hypothetical protein
VTVAETLAEIASFQPHSDLPNIARPIDGTHFKIRAPKVSAVDYFSRYHKHDIVVQGIVNGRMLFMDVAAGFPGSMLVC